MRTVSGLFIAIVLCCLTAAAAEPLRDGYPASLKGLIYKDAASNVVVYVETDGRHVVCISLDGKMLWRKDPFVDAGLRPYREARPTIDKIQASPKAGFAWITFTSSQMGEIDLATGAFTFGGQN